MTTTTSNKVPVSGRRRQLVPQPVTNPPWAVDLDLFAAPGNMTPDGGTHDLCQHTNVASLIVHPPQSACLEGASVTEVVFISRHQSKTDLFFVLYPGLL